MLIIIRYGNANVGVYLYSTRVHSLHISRNMLVTLVLFVLLFVSFLLFRCCYLLFSIQFCFIHFVVPIEISPMGNSGRFPQGKPGATESRYPTVINYCVHTGSFRVSRTPPNSDMDYRIFDVRT